MNGLQDVEELIPLCCIQYMLRKKKNTDYPINSKTSYIVNALLFIIKKEKLVPVKIMTP